MRGNKNIRNVLLGKPVEFSLEHCLEQAKAESGGQRDIKFLRYLIDSNLISMGEFVLKRSNSDMNEEYYRERYQQNRYESDRHFLCRAVIQDELEKLGIETYSTVEAGDLSILRCTASYDIVTADWTTLIDVGLTPARNFFKGLTDLKVQNYLISNYFDDYMDEIVFISFQRVNDDDFLSAVKDYEEGFKLFIPIANHKAPEYLTYEKPKI